MVLDAVSVVDRRRLKRRLTAWRIAAVLFAILFLGALMLSDKNVAGSAGFLPHIARIDVSGIITDDRKMSELFDKVAKADQVKAVILDINSPGGTTTGGEAMYDAIRRLAEKKPVVAVCGTLATSAAYIVALATDRIFVYGNTITGSVGVIFQWADVTELLHTLGVKVEEVKSGPLKAVPSPFEPADAKTLALSQEMVQEAKTWFVQSRRRAPQDRSRFRSGAHRWAHLFGPPGGRAEARRSDRRGEGCQDLAQQGAQRSLGPQDRRLEAGGGKFRPLGLVFPLDDLFCRHFRR